jgi:uncharacterized protein
MQRSSAPLSDAEIAELDECLSSIHAPLQPMDVCALDGYLCAVLLQPVTISCADWLPLIFDVDGRSAPESEPARRAAELAQRRHDELARAISRREWFDPWIFEPDDPAASPQQALLPWVAGFAAALERFPALSSTDSPDLVEPLAVLFSVFAPEDLEDAEDLLPVIETLEPPSTMAEAAEDLVRSVLLLADVSQPRQRLAGPARGARKGPRQR